MRKRSIVLLAGAAAIAATLVVGPTATASSDRASAGTVVFIHDQEPPNLQGPWVGNNLYATSLVINNIWYGGQIRNNKAALAPRLYTSKPKIVKKKPLTIGVEFRKDANWSDGKPVTVKDLRATWQVFINPKNNVISRTGWEDVRSITGGAKKGVIVVQEAVRRLGGPHFERRLPGARHRGPGHEPDVPELDPRIERSVALRQLAEGRAACGTQERRLQVPARR